MTGVSNPARSSHSYGRIEANSSATMEPMKIVPLSEAKDKLSALVEEVQSEHEIVRITRHGQAAAVLISEDDLESLQETLFWLSQPGIRDDLAEAESGEARGADVSASDIRQRFGLPAQ